MNFYDFHIGDYASRTAHLEPMEDLAYRRLLDLYYVREEALPKDVAETARLIRLRGQDAVIQAVLSEFFVQTEAGWEHDRCEAVIAKANEKKGKAKASADKRWAEERAKAEAEEMRTHNKRTANALPTQSQGNAPSPSPTTQSQKKPPKSPKGEPVGFKEFYEAYPRKEARPKAARAFAGIGDVPLETMLAAITWMRTSDAWKKDGGKYIPLPATWLNDRRWEDERKSGYVADVREWHESESGVRAKAKELGLPEWNKFEEHWPTFKQRVMKAERQSVPGLTIEQLLQLVPKKEAA